jgi:transposase InsO family protein
MRFVLHLREVPTMLVELGLVEQRHKAVLEVLAGDSVSEVAGRCGVSRQTLHRWLRRYGSSGLAGLVDRSCRPDRCPHQMSPLVEARILELRLAHPGWGPRTIRHRLEQAGTKPLPGRSSIYRCLVRHRLVDPKKRKRRREDYRRWERTRSMELWQMDIMGGVKLASGGELQIVTGLDDHSRFCVVAELVARATARPVCQALAHALQTFGVPDQVLTDNGKVFTSRFGRGKGEVLFDRICRENGIKHLLTAPHSPTTTGKVERFHKTVRSEFLADRRFATQEQAQAALDAWVALYNKERPHQGIGMVPPAKRFALAVKEAPEQATMPELGALEDGKKHLKRVVGQNGRISLFSFPYHVGAYLAGETVEVTVSEDGLVEISHGDTVVAAHARRHSVDKEPATLRRPKAQPRQPKLAGVPVIRLTDSHGIVSFAGTSYRVGSRFARKQVEVRVTGDTVQILCDGKLVRTHPARHDRQKEFGAFANPGGRPQRKNSASNFNRSTQAEGTVTEEPESIGNTGTGT